MKIIKNKSNNQRYAIEMLNITKTFGNGKIIANDDLILRVKPNTIHAIIGENGAGKSTLMSILFGTYQPDSGEIFLNGIKTHFKSSSDASAYGVGMVPQHFKLIDNYSLWKNVVLGFEYTEKTILKSKKIIDNLAILSKKYNFNLDLKIKAGKASVIEQQKTEILKLLYRNADILIFDEPTAILNDIEIKHFLKILENFKKEGKTIILITHKLHEVKEIADEATIIRFGKNVGEVINVQKTSVETMAKMMVGKDLEFVHNDEPLVNREELPVILDVNNLVLRSATKTNLFSNLSYDGLKGFKNTFIQWKNNFDIFFNINKQSATSQDNLINFQVRAGEILGIAGVEGNGQTELALTFGGLLKSRHGKIKIWDNKKKKMIDITNKNINFLRKNKISYVPEDRHKHGLILDNPIAQNGVLGRIQTSAFNFLGFIKRHKINMFSNNLVKKYDVRGVSNNNLAVRNLSGGNQQKYIIGREFENDHDFLILVQPTRGLDLGAVEWIHKLILTEKILKKAIILISYDLDELLSLSDTVAVMSRSKFLINLPKEKITREEIGLLMAGELQSYV